MKRFSVVVALFLALAGTRAEGPDDQYVRIYNLIQEADRLSSGGQPGEALPKYLEAQAGLERFQKGFPDWNATVVAFRLNYVAGKIAGMSQQTRAPDSAGKQPVTPPGPRLAQPAKAAPSDWEAQLAALAEQARQLQADKAVLEAKLKEALSVQPAAMDPRDLARAEERIKVLQKENDLLKASLDQEKAKPVPAPDRKALDEARQALGTANSKLAEQSKLANDLARDKAALQEKLNALARSTVSAAELETTKKALQDATVKLSEQTKLTSDLTAEKEALKTRLKSASSEAEAAAALRTENQLLKQQLAELKAAPPPADKAEEVRRKLAEAQAQVAALQSDKELLRLEKLALEDRVKRMESQPVNAATPSKGAKAADAARIKELERERDDLKKQLAAANKELNSRKSKAAAARAAEIEQQLAVLRARLEVYEARQVPYTAEELALLSRPPAKPTQAEPKAAKTSAKELPPGTVALSAETQRQHANKQADRAQEASHKVPPQEKSKPSPLAKQAAAELELNHLEAAEINIKQAVAQAPNDPYSLSVLGRLKLRQKKYDEAVDAFGLAARAAPQDAQIQNLLGLALSERGLRGPAETALRRAIQLDPGFADAHYNLAVVYFGQQPPLVELARWHYQKAIAVGHPQNPELEKRIEAAKAANNAP
jgi:Tfp pilus assembly protein PilF